VRVAATVLLVACGGAAVSAVACAQGASGRSLLGASAVVVLLSLAAPVLLGFDGQVSPAGGVLFGGAAGLLAVIAGLLSL
jgi:hypothetical protein